MPPKDRVRHRAQVAERNKRIAAANRVLLYEYLSEHPCVDCGEEDPIVLEFDHVRGEKLYEIGSMPYYKWETILLEINKCDVRCCNCHRRKTAKERDYYHYKLKRV